MSSYDGVSAATAQQPVYQPFSHLTAPNAALYRRIMAVFVAAKERFAVHLRPEDVHAALPPGERPAEAEAVVLERFIQDLITKGAEIAQLLTGLRPHGLLRMAAAREASDAAPEPDSRVEEEAYQRWVARWEGLTSWFILPDLSGTAEVPVAPWH